MRMSHFAVDFKMRIGARGTFSFHSLLDGHSVHGFIHISWSLHHVLHVVLLYQSACTAVYKGHGGVCRYEWLGLVHLFISTYVTCRSGLSLLM